MAATRALGLMLLLSLALAGAQINAIISGEFFAVDPVRADGVTAFVHATSTFVPLSGVLHQSFSGAAFQGPAAAISDNGDIVYKSGSGAAYAPSIASFANASSSGVKSAVARFLGSATIFTVGQDTTPQSARTYTADMVQSMGIDDPDDSLIVCVVPPATSIPPAYTASGLGGPSEFPSVANGTTPTVPQLVEFLSSTFANDVMNSLSSQPRLITPPFQLNGFSTGVDCQSLKVVSGYVYARANGGPYFLRAPGATSWTQITGTGPNAGSANALFGPGNGPVATPNSQMRFSGTTAYLYSLDPNLSPAANSTVKNIWSRAASGGSWQPVMASQALADVIVYDFAVSPAGSVYMTFQPTGRTPVPYVFPYSVDSYVFKAQPSSNWAPVAPLWRLYNSDNTGMSSANVRLHWDTAATPAGFLVVYGQQLNRATTSTQASAPNSLPASAPPQLDWTFWSRPLGGVACLTSAEDAWQPCYGGGFTLGSGPQQVGRGAFCSSAGITYFFGVSGFVYNRYSGPVAYQRAQNGARWTDIAEQAASGSTPAAAALPLGLPLDGGDFRSAFTDFASVHEAYTDPVLGLVIAGEFRSAQSATVFLNSVAYLPSPTLVCGLRSGPATAWASDPQTIATGVRNSDVGIPENFQFSPGEVNEVLWLPGSNAFYVGGSFDFAGNQPAANIARFTVAAGATLPCTAATPYTEGAWAEVNGGIDGTVLTMLLVSNGQQIAVGGQFDRAGLNVYSNNVALYDIPSDSWLPMNGGLDGMVTKLIMFNGQLLAIGAFTTSGGSGVSLPGVAIWDGTRWFAPPVLSLPSACTAGCAAPCANPFTCNPGQAWADARVIADNIVLLLSSTGLLGAFNAGTQVGFQQVILPGPYNTFDNPPGAHAIGYGSAVGDWNIYNLATSPGTVYPSVHATWSQATSNFMYRQGVGANGIVWSNQPLGNGYPGLNGATSSRFPWAWVIVGILAALLVICVIFFLYRRQTGGDGGGGGGGRSMGGGGGGGAANGSSVPYQLQPASAGGAW